MIDLAFIREHADLVRQALVDLNSSAPIDEILSLDQQRRDLLAEVEALRAERNRVSKEIPRIKDKAERQLRIDAMRQVADRIKEIDALLGPAEERLREALLEVPNLPDPSVPIGVDESQNAVIQTIGDLPSFDFEPQPHWDLGAALDLIDFERGVKLSGSRFYLLKGAGARLQRALIAWMLDVHIQQHGYTEIYPPYLVHAQALVGTGNLPKFGDNLYHDAEEDLWLIPTAEVPVTNMYGEELLEQAQLPIHHVAYTACFRREKMSAGKDTRGIKRGHQFDKVELYKYVVPETSDAELDTLVANAEEVLRRLGLAYRVVQLCTGDLGFAACKTFDIEVWAPGCKEWLEVSSCSNCGDFQARRANLRFRPEAGARPQFVHTLNGSGLALPRVFIAVLENFQQPDGTILVPEVLNRYM